MEQDKLKDAWQLLNESLNKQEILKESILKGMIHTKADKSLSKLLNTEVAGLIVLILAFPLIIYILNRGIKLPEYNIFMWITMVICVILFFWQSLKVYKLTRIDLSKTISNNMKYMNEYNIWIKKERIVMTFLGPLLILGIAYIYAITNVSIAVWIFLICLALAITIYSYWAYKKLYGKNIKSILKSLDELKELEEE